MNLSVLEKLTYEEIKKVYTSGIKSKTDFKVGFEYERIPIQKTKFFSADYHGATGICNLLRILAQNDNWDYILDKEQIIGLKQQHDTITLEPGSQIELSLEPKKNILDIEHRVKYLDSQFNQIFSDTEIELINYGVSPVSTYRNIKIIPKERYHIMANYLWGILSDVMMRETAGIQGTFDFSSEEDAMNKFRIANILSPFVTAMFANSPIRGGVDTGYKSFRALSWLFTDDERCGYFYDFNKDSTFDDYIEFVMNTPMLFITRNNKHIKFNGRIDFSTYMGSKFKDITPELDDYLLQANLCFPDVRLRNFIEVRNQDCNGNGLQYAMLALYKGILYDNDACESVTKLLKSLKMTDYQELRYCVPKYALDTNILKSKVKDYAKEIIFIAENSLKNNFPNELEYLDYLKEYTMQGYSPADIILKNWYGSWNKNISKLIEFITKK